MPEIQIRPSIRWKTISIRRGCPVRRPVVVMSIVPPRDSAARTESSTMDSSGPRRCSLLGLLRPFAFLVPAEGFGGIDIAERHVVGRIRLPAVRSHVQPLAEDRNQRACLHRAEPGQIEETRLEI